MITVIGSLNIDLTTVVDHYPRLGETYIGNKFNKHYGGKGANQAVAIARLGGSVRMIGCVGDDSFGKEYTSYLKNENIIIDNVVPVTHSSTGTASIIIADNDNLIIVVPGANYELTPEKIEQLREVISQSSIILMQLEIPLETIEAVLQIAKEYDVKVVLNPAPFQPIPAHWWDMITHMTPNEHEAESLMQDPSFKQEYKDKLIITQGGNGITFYENGIAKTIPAPKVDVVDTTGAGDTFNGAFTYFLDEGYSLEQACQFAVRAASLSVTKMGAQSGIPTMEELTQFIFHENNFSLVHSPNTNMMQNH